MSELYEAWKAEGHHTEAADDHKFGENPTSDCIRCVEGFSYVHYFEPITSATARARLLYIVEEEGSLAFEAIELMQAGFVSSHRDVTVVAR